jgi:hypothetical protein
MRVNYKGDGKYANIAAALNEIGKWINSFGVAAPLMLRSQPGGGVRIGIDEETDGSTGGLSQDVEFVSGLRWSGSSLQVGVSTATYNDGHLDSIEGPTWQTVFDTGECP